MSTLQTSAVLDALRRRGHATNLEIHEDISAALPGVLVQSVHRITARLLEAGVISVVPSSHRTAVLDARPEPHHHFVCTSCGGILDIEVPATAIASIQEQVGVHLVDDGLVVRGRCAACRTDLPRQPHD